MIELALTLRAIQSSFMVYKWTMAMQFSFEYCIDPKDHKSEEDIKAICSLQESSRHVLSLPDEEDGWFIISRRRETIWRFEIVAALFVVMPTHYLYAEMCDLIKIYLRWTPTGEKIIKIGNDHMLTIYCKEHASNFNNYDVILWINE